MTCMLLFLCVGCAVNRSRAQTPDVESIAVSAPKVTLLSKGKRPFHALRFRLEKGDKQTVFVTTNMSVLSSVDGQVGPKSRPPALINEIAFQVDEATPEGDFRVSFVVTKAALGQAKGMNEAALAQLKEAIGVITGLQGSHRFNSRGFVADVELDVPPSAPDALHQTLDGLKRSLRQIVAPLPKQKVGRGAQWRVDTEFEHNGIRVKQSSTFTVRALDVPGLDIEVSTQQTAPPQTVYVPGAPPEQLPKLDSLELGAHGRAHWNLVKLAPTNAHTSTTLNMAMTTPDAQGRLHKVRITMETDSAMTTDEHASPVVDAAFDDAMVPKRLRARIPAIKRCYEDELLKDSSLSGTVTMVFTIEESGGVSDASASQNTTGSEALAACVAEELLLLRFDAGPKGGGVTFEYPFTFTPAAE